MKIATMNIEKLLPAGYNPRKDLKPGDKEYEKIKRSMTEFGYVDPVVWNERTGRVVGGHQRLKILQEMGITQVDVSVVDLDEAEEKALNLALNKISGEWDLPKLKDLLEELDAGDIDMDITGFDAAEIEDLFTQAHQGDTIVEDEVPDLPHKPTTKPGDTWQLGRHRVYCGDATTLTDVERLMNGKQADMVFTDPPYNVDCEGATKEKLKIQNDKMSNDKFYQFLYDSFLNMLAVTVEGGGIYICHADSEGINFRTAMVDAGWLQKQCLIWAKSSIVMGRQDYHWKHEPHSLWLETGGGAQVVRRQEATNDYRGFCKCCS